ncbi:MAG: hypothetical protein HY064_08355 [Bacteroidetes bacterium]|nr:hypothetical protein [Bacteroidota bacterium]
MKNKFLLLAAAVLLSLSPVLAGTNTAPKKSASIDNTTSYCGVTAQQIYDYMLSHGITIKSIETIPGSCNVYVYDVNNIKYIVYISNGVITGYDVVNG